MRVSRRGLAVCVAGIMSIGPATDAPAQSGRPFVELLGSSKSDENLRRVFRLMDGNADQGVDRTEFRVEIVSAHTLLDRNKDGRLSRDELPAVKGTIFLAADLNDDGVLSAFEFTQAKFVRFDAMDGNRDGRITFEELLAYRRALQ